MTKAKRRKTAHLFIGFGGTDSTNWDASKFKIDEWIKYVEGNPHADLSDVLKQQINRAFVVAIYDQYERLQHKYTRFDLFKPFTKRC